jgi:hypothetical protein
MTMESTSRPRVGDVMALRMWPGRVICDPVCMQPRVLSSFSFESGFHFGSRGVPTVVPLPSGAGSPAPESARHARSGASHG